MNDRARGGGGRAIRLAGTALLAVVALGAFLGAVELSFRLAGYQPIHAVYSRPSLFWRHDPLLGWSHEPGATGTFVGPRPFPIEYEAPVRINALGLRGPEIPEATAHECRVLVLGDSAVAAFEVALEDTFVAGMERKLRHRAGRRRVRVVNGGVRGYGTDQILLFYRERGHRLDADVVFLVHNGNDPNDNMTLHRMRRPFGKPAFAVREDGALELVGSPVPPYPLCSAYMLDATYEPGRVDGAPHRALCWLQTRFADHSALLSFVTQRMARLPGWLYFIRDLAYPSEQMARWGPRPAPREAGMGAVGLGVGTARADAPAELARASSRLTTELIRALAREVRGRGAHFMLLIKPEHLAQLDGEALEADGIEIHHVRVSENLHFSMRFQNDGHYNEFGHSVMATALAPLVEPHLRGCGRSR